MPRRIVNYLSKLGIFGLDGTTLSSATNPVPVGPGTSTTWNISSLATRLIGAITGINGTGIATGANPVPVQLSDGAAVFTGAKTGQLPTALGAQAPTTSLGVAMPQWAVAAFSSFAAAGVILVSSAGTFRGGQVVNNAVGSVIVQIFDSGLPSGGAVPLVTSATTVTGGIANPTPFGEAGVRTATKVTMAISVTSTTFTAGVVTTYTGFTATST